LLPSRYPALAANDQKEYQAFWSAFVYLLYARRADAPNTRVATDTWVEQANDWLKARQQGFVPTTGKALVAAAICHGIAYSEPPYPALALAHGSRSEMQPTAWRKTVEAGQLPAPTAVAKSWDASISTAQRYSV
jgi:hypothetical protein